MRFEVIFVFYEIGGYVSNKYYDELKELSAPIKKGQQIGEIIITLNGETIAKSNLIANKDVKKMSAANYFVNMFTHLFK